MVIGINQDAYRVDKANWQIYSGLSSGVGTLNGDGLTAVSFRCAVTISAITGHADCAGSITIGSETLTFTAAGKKTTTTTLTTLPVITTSGLDCNILVEAITTGGAPIVEETAIALKTRFENTQKSYLNSQGIWSKSQAVAYVMDSSCDIGTKFSQGGYDYTVDQVRAFPDLRGREVFTEELRKVCAKKDSHPLLWRMLARELHWEARHVAKATRWLRRYHRSRMDATAVLTSANLLWDDRRREEATVLYRLASCLNDKNESFSMSYFKAARWVRRTR